MAADARLHRIGASRKDIMATCKVVVVEDDGPTRAFFVGSIAACPELDVAASFPGAVQACDWLRSPGNAADVLLTDLGLPDGSGLDVIRCAIEQHPACECLVVSMFGDEDSVLASIEAGALGYVHKDSAPEDIARTILQMRAGASPISPMIARRVLTRLKELRPAAEAAPAARADRPQLTGREQEAIELIARGFSYAEIAKLQGVSVHTVQTHIKNLYRKLAVKSGREAIYEARQLGLLP
jgi:DNA-binding NarL/FixJ family response regulator